MGDLKAEMYKENAVHDGDADLSAKFTDEPLDISQHVNIDLDLGACKDQEQENVLAEGFLNLEWWHYLFIGLGFAVILVAGCLFKSREQSPLENGLPQYF